MQRGIAGAAVIALAALAAGAAAVDRVYIVNEDSHPHEVQPGASARFSLERSAAGALMDVKCSLRGDEGMPAGKVTLRTHGLGDVVWPYASRSILVEHPVDFDILARIEDANADAAYFEFVNEDPVRRLWHQCYNN